MRLFIIFLLAIATAYGCKKNEVVPNIDHSSKYQPLEVGHIWTYDVDSIVFYGNGSQKPDTFHYEVRHTVVSSFEDNANRTAFLIKRETKSDSLSDWMFKENFSEAKTTTELLRTTNDETIIPFSFPIVVNKEWDANQYNNKPKLETFYEETHIANTFGSLSYDSTSVVFQEEEINAVNRRFVIETYAANYGMVKREVENISGLESSDPKGTTYTFVLKSFEK